MTKAITSNTPRSSAPRSEECCTWCRQPISLCRDSSCDYAQTYTGVLRHGRWQSLESDEDADRPAGMLAARPAPLRAAAA